MCDNLARVVDTLRSGVDERVVKGRESTVAVEKVVDSAVVLITPNDLAGIVDPSGSVDRASGWTPASGWHRSITPKNMGTW
jgi:hypothetical protein